MSKLDDLCAIKVMGWRKSEPWIVPGGNMKGQSLPRDYPYEDPTPELAHRPVFRKDWSPSTSLDDALLCLERAADERESEWELSMFPDNQGEGKLYDVFMAGGEVSASGETPPLAMCICALRAMGVPESEISLAMEN